MVSNTMEDIEINVDDSVDLIVSFSMFVSLGYMSYRV